MDPQDRYISLAEVPALYPFSIGTVYNLIRDGEIKALKIGRKSIVARSEVEGYIARKARPLELKGSKGAAA